MNPSNSPAGTIPEIKLIGLHWFVKDCLRADHAFMPQKSTTIIGLNCGECYHRVYFLYKTGE
ncbi:hypothetical protein BZP36_25560 [Raoultella terrigena]|nr:hypothetical protein BZP36_25560 [Raoultella terrigena]HCR58520.1 hypothetical protein [Raoultella sp.]